LRRLVERDPESVRGAILARIELPGLHGEKEAGWLDEDRCAFVTEIIDADVMRTLIGGFVEPSPPTVMA
jgi:hypothetical protein